MIDETISNLLIQLPFLIKESTFTIEDVQDQLFPFQDIMHAWPKSLKDPAEYQSIAHLFDPLEFWKFANPWDLTICTRSNPFSPINSQSDVTLFVIWHELV